MADEPDKPEDDMPPLGGEPPERDWLFAPAPASGAESPSEPAEPVEVAPPVEPDPGSAPESGPELIIEPEPVPVTPPPPPPIGRPEPPRDGPRPRPARRRRGLLSRLFMLLVVVVFVIPTVMVALYRFIPPPGTALMVIRAAEGKGWDYRWRPLSRVSPALVQSLVAAEDARFCEHGGFDMEAIEKARRNNQRRPGRMRGGSTISQQTAKNVFLWPARSYVRKGLEAYFTVLIEALWGKRRIMEVYLNVAEWGPGVYGAEAAAHRWFGKDADQLTRAEASRLAAILPSPLKWKAAASGPYVRKRARRIGAASGTVRADGLAACVAR